MIEEWKDITGYEGYYQVSNLGRVKSVDRIIIQKTNAEYPVKERILRQAKIKSGYLVVNLFKSGLGKTYLVHRLVAAAFIDKVNDTFEVNHKDENKLNNRLYNLEWISRLDNIRYGTGISRCIISSSKNIIQMDLNGNVIKVWLSEMDIERTLGFSNSSVGNACTGLCKTSHGFKWKFAQ